MKQPIFTNFAPNQRWQDIKLACKYFLPWNWNKLIKGKEVKKVEKWFNNFLGNKYSFCFDSGRSSLYLALKSLEVNKGDEVIIPGYTCIVVSNAVKKTGAKPIFVDINQHLNLDPKEIKDKINNNTKAIIAQHTFGKPVQIRKIKQIAEENELAIIEDCAHSLGGKYKNHKLGNFGDISIFSFGVDKVVSSVRGGLVSTNDKKIANKLEKYQQGLSNISYLNLFKHLIYYPIFSIGKKLYHIKLGKIILYLTRKFKIIASIIKTKEKNGGFDKKFPTKLPNSLASLAKKQLNFLNNYTKHRKKIAKIYNKKLPGEIIAQPYNNQRTYLNFPILVKNKDNLLKLAKNKGFLLGKNWSGSNIVPVGSSREEVGYKPGSCPKAEKLSEHIILLPTNINISKKEARDLADFIVKLIKKNKINYVQN